MEYGQSKLCSLESELAWLLEYEPGRKVAFGRHQTVELIDQSPVIEVPGMPYYACGLMAWQGRHIPLIDLYTLLRGYPDIYRPKRRHTLVLAYTVGDRGDLEFAALCAPGAIESVKVSNDMVCDLPTHSDLWPELAISCFRLDGVAVPILDASVLFSRCW